MLYLVGNNHEKYFSHSELRKGDRNRCTPLLSYFSDSGEEVGINKMRGSWFNLRQIERNASPNSRPGSELVRWESHNQRSGDGDRSRQCPANCTWQGQESRGCLLPELQLHLCSSSRPNKRLSLMLNKHGLGTKAANG